MSRINSVLNYLKIHSYRKIESWNIAIRKRDDTMLFEGNNRPFKVLKNNQKYWKADPFLYECEGKHYLFCELFDQKQNKGVIGVSQIKKNGQCAKFHVCVEGQYHYSYPCVFEKNGVIYMIPECSQSGEVALYRATSFPMKWEKIEILAYCKGSDTTPILPQETSQIKYLTTVYTDGNYENDNLYLIQDTKTPPELLVKNDYTARSAGQIFRRNERMIRPSQDDEKTYGNRLLFKEIDCIKGATLIERFICAFKPPKSPVSDNEYNIQVDKSWNSVVFTGVHTYNFDSSYEVIDLKRDQKSELATLIRYLSKKVKQRLQNR